MDDIGSIPTPVESRDVVRPEWIDYNGHMNVAYYVLAFDRATDALLDRLGIGEAYRRRTDCSTFALEAHVTYVGELRAGDKLRVTSQVIAHDAKRLHHFHRMTHGETGALAATLDCVSLHVELERRRAAPFPAAISARLAAFAAAHAVLPRPPELGRSVGLGNRAAPRS